MSGCPSITIGREASAGQVTDGAQGRADEGVIDPAPFVRTEEVGRSEVELLVRGARCAGCISKIENGVGALNGVVEVRLNLSTGRLRVTFDRRCLAPVALTRALKRLGYDAYPFDARKAAEDVDKEGQALLRALAVAGFAAANVMLLSISVWAGEGEMGGATKGAFHWISALIAIPTVAYSGRPFFASAWRALEARHANMDVPISLAVLLAVALSVFEATRVDGHVYFDAAVSLLFFLLIGRYLDHRLRNRARAAARELLALQATSAQRLDQAGVPTRVAVDDVQAGDRLLIRPGDRTPVDVVVETGASDADFSLATGESAPLQVSVGDRLPSGVVNLSGALTVRAEARAGDSFLAELGRLIEVGEQGRSGHVRLADRAAALYVPIVHAAAMGTFVIWLLLGAELREAALSAIALLIITCPCALGLAAPAVQVVATGRLFKAGVFVKAGDALERLASVDHAVFDKTGTLTRGALELVNKDDIPRAALEDAAQLARASDHPASKAIARAAGPGPFAIDIQEMPGRGVTGRVSGVLAFLGRSASAPTSGGTMVAFERDGAAPIAFALRDGARPDAAETLASLSRRGISLELLSGDRRAPTCELAAELDMTEWRAEASPADKAERLAALTADGSKVLMVGDGLNDAPALAAAHTSISFGAAAEVSQHTADFVIQGERLGPIVEALDVARAARRRILENFGFAAFYNAVAMPLAAFGVVTPLIAAVAMSSSSVIVMLNALRLAGRSGQ